LGRLTERQKARAAYVDSSIVLEDGDTQRAIKQLQRAAEVARDAPDLELLCKVQMRLLLVIADLSGPDAAAPILSELRRTATMLGDVQSTAAVHVFVAEMEARKGLFHSAERHLRISVGLISDAPNPWLYACIENIRLATCVLLSDANQASAHAVRGLSFAETSGVASIRRAIYANDAALHFSLGLFNEATQYLDRALSLFPSSGERLAWPESCAAV
jgi:tetratricopeptide (TPR) repeat protein